MSRAFAQLSPEDSILFDQVGHSLLLAAVQPAGQRNEKQPRATSITAEVYITNGGSNLDVVWPSRGVP